MPIDAVNKLIVVSKEEDLFSESFIAEDFVWAEALLHQGNKRDLLMLEQLKSYAFVYKPTKIIGIKYFYDC